MKRIVLIALPVALLLATIGHAQYGGPISADSSVSFADAPYGNAYGDAPSATTPSRRWPQADDAEAVLLVPGPGMSEQHRSELTADLDVMCALLDRLLGDAGLSTQTWGPRVGRYRRSTRSLYLPGFGALFLLEADFPLVAPAATETSTDEETTDALWTQVRQDMRSQGRRTRNTGQRTRAQYDDLKVQSLQRMLQRALTHCANLRHLAPDDQIIAVAINANETRPVTTGFRSSGAYGYGSYYEPQSAPGHGVLTGVLALKTTKKDVDAFAGSQVSAADFAERVQTLRYQLPPLEADPAAQRQSR